MNDGEIRKNEITDMRNEFVDVASGIVGSVAGLVINTLIDPVTGALTAPMFATSIKSIFGKSCTENVEKVAILQGVKIKELEEKLQKLAMNRLQTPQGAEFQYQVCWQGLSAFTEDRRERIVNLAIKGLSGTDDDLSKAAHFLRIQAQLSDEDIALLLEHDTRSQNQFEISIRLSRERLLASYGFLSVSQSDLGSIGSNAFNDGAKEAFRITEIGREFLQYFVLDKV